MDRSSFDALARASGGRTSRRMMLRRLGEAGAAAALLTGTGTRARAQATPPAAASPIPRRPGELGTAFREFKASTSRLTGPLDVQFRLAAFDTPAHAEAAFALVEPALRAQYPTLRPRPTPLLGDQVAAYAGRIQEGTTPVRVAVLVVRAGSDVHVWIGVGFYDDPLGDLLALAGRWFPRPGTATPAATPSAGVSPAALLAQLPGLRDLPAGGYVLVQEGTTNAAGTPTP